MYDLAGQSSTLSSSIIQANLVLFSRLELRITDRLLPAVLDTKTLRNYRSVFVFFFSY